MAEMQAVMKLKAEKGMTLTTTKEPAVKPDYLKVKVRATAICGTDKHIFDWHAPWDTRIKPPKIIGHELCGEVVEIGGHVSGFEVGDMISAETHVADWTCPQCLRGNAHICQNMKLFGVDIDGVFADYAVVPARNAWKNDPSIPFEMQAVQEPLGNSVYTTYSTNLPGKRVSIFGCGPTGLFSIALAKAAGASQVIAVAGSKTHLDLAKKMGATHIINRHEKDPATEILEITGEGADIMLEMSGSASALDQGLKSLRQGGEVSILGLYSKPPQIDWSKDIVLKNVTLYGINGRLMFKTWETVAWLLREKVIDISPVITHKFKLSEFDKAMEVALSGECGKVIMFPK
ncbi:MAG: L-threonine 3-dehydrogenase [archaeon]